jgi:hypothetical protein
MKSLTPNTLTAIDSPYVAPILLVTIEFSSPGALALYLCSRQFDTLNMFDDQIYDDLIVSWGTIRTGEIDPTDYRIRAGDLQIDLNNTEPVGGYDRFSALLAAYDWAFATVTVRLIHEGATDPDDAVSIFKGKIETPEAMSRESVSLRVSDISLSYLNAWPHTVVSTDDYADADPDDVGKMFPQVWGSCKRVPARAVAAGWVTTLAEDLDDSETSVDLTDVSGLPSSGAVQIDAEQISYTGKSGNTLTGCTRGYNATSAVEHDYGAGAAEVQSEYFYIVADHPVKAIDAVYVDGIRQPGANYTAYTGQTGDEHASYTGKAVIKFTTRPAITKQINIDLDKTDTLSVTNGTLSVSDPGHTHEPNEDNIVSWEFDTFVSSSGGLYPYAWFDGNDETQTDLTNQNDHSVACLSEERTFSGNPGWYRLCVRVGTVTETASTAEVRFSYAGLDAEAYQTDENSVVYTSWQNPGTSWNEWSEFAAANAQIIRVDNWGNGFIGIKKAWMEIENIPVETEADVTMSGDVSKTGTITYELTGNSSADTVIGNVVSADVNGYQDDASGTITGTPNALIERPDHILTHMLTEVLGLSSSDVDSTSYTSSGASYASASFTLGVCLVDPPKNINDFFSKIARQCRSMQFWEAGVHHLVYVGGTAAPTTDKTVMAHQIDLNQLWISTTRRDEIRNSLTGPYDKYWSGFDDDVEADRAIATSTVAASIAKYGTLSEQVGLEYITGATMAGTVLSGILGERHEPRISIDFVGDPSLLDIERGDVIAFDTTDDYLDDAMLDMVPAEAQFLVLKKDIEANFKIVISAISFCGFATQSVGAATEVTRVAITHRALTKDVVWSNYYWGKVVLQSGEFTATVKSEQDVTSWETWLEGASYDGTNTPFTGQVSDSLYLLSGQFSSTLKTSYSVPAGDNPMGISWDGTNTPWVSAFTGSTKLVVQSGQFSATIKTSVNVGSRDGFPSGVCFDGTNTPWSGYENDKLYLYSGEISTTLKASISTSTTYPEGISYNGTDTLWCDSNTGYLYRWSGQFTSTLKSSYDTGGEMPTGIESCNMQALF